MFFFSLYLTMFVPIDVQNLDHSLQMMQLAYYLLSIVQVHNSQLNIHV